MPAVDLEAWEEMCYAEEWLGFLFPFPLLDLDRTHIYLLQSLIPSNNIDFQELFTRLGCW